MTSIIDPALDPLPNVPLLRKVREHIGAHPEEWWQGSWRIIPDGSLTAPSARRAQRQVEQPFCGTTYCFAGWATTLAGLEWINNFAVRDDAGRYVDPGEAAADLLGLSDGEAFNLFHGGNDLAAIDHVLARIYTRAGERP